MLPVIHPRVKTLWVRPAIPSTSNLPLRQSIEGAVKNRCFIINLALNYLIQVQCIWLLKLNNFI